MSGDASSHEARRSVTASAEVSQRAVAVSGTVLGHGLPIDTTTGPGSQ